MNRVNLFINYLCGLDLAQNPCKISSNMYNELETLDVDLEEKRIMENENLPREVRIKIVDLIEFYYLKVDDYIYKSSNKEVYMFLRELKARAEEINSNLID